MNGALTPGVNKGHVSCNASYVPGTILSSSHLSTLSPPVNYMIVISPLKWMKKLRHRKVKQLPQSHTANQ